MGPLHSARDSGGILAWFCLAGTLSDLSCCGCVLSFARQEQTPQASKPNPNAPTRAQVGDWYVYNNTNDVCGLAPGNHTIVDGGQVGASDSSDLRVGDGKIGSGSKRQ